MDNMKKEKSTKNRIKSFSTRAKIVVAFTMLSLVGLGYVVYAAINTNKSDIAVNDFTVAHLEGKIDEAFDPDSEVKITSKIEKNVIIKNTGNTNLFVRVMVLPEMTSKDGIQLPANIKETTEAGTASGQVELLQEKDTDWVNGQDNYYYYTKKIAPTKSSSSLFTGIKLDNTLLEAPKNPSNANEFFYYAYEGGKLQITLKEETITSKDEVYQEAWSMKDEQGNFKNTSLETIANLLDKEKE